MNNTNFENKLQDAAALLSELGLPLTEQALHYLHVLANLVGEWNGRSGLCSNSELPFLWDRHILDSLSLLPYLQAATVENKQWLDIGCGGGFPMLPCKVFLPELPVLGIERTEKKIGYLHFSIAQLELKNISLKHGAFPQVLPKAFRTGVITARAVEKPETWAKGLLPLIQEGAVFLCQQPETPQTFSKLFHVEQIDDMWSKKGLRRGQLHIIFA